MKMTERFKSEILNLLVYSIGVFIMIVIVILIKQRNIKITNLSDEIDKLETRVHKLEVAQSNLTVARAEDLQMIRPMWEVFTTENILEEEEPEISVAPIIYEEIEVVEEILEEIIPEVKLIVANPDNLTEVSNVTVEHLKKTLDGTALSGLEHCYVRAEEESGINAIFLCALSIQESGWGKSNFAKTRNNLFGLKAYNHNTDNASTFNSKEENILYAGSYIYNNYLVASGKHHNGVSVESINKKYAVNNDGSPNYHWSQNIRKIMKKLKEA